MIAATYSSYNVEDGTPTFERNHPTSYGNDP